MLRRLSCKHTAVLKKTVLKKTTPVLNLVLNFQILENPDLKYLNHILEKKFTGPPVHATTALLLPGCQDNSCEQPNRGAVACANDARQAVLVEPLPPGLNEGHRPVSPDGQWVRLG